MKWRSLEESVPGTDTRPLHDTLAERKELIAKYVPSDIQAVHTRVISELRKNRIGENVLAIGTKAPAFELGRSQRSTSFFGTFAGARPSRDLLLSRAWCPFCVGQLEAMNLLLPQIEQAGASLVAISPQTVQQSFFMVDQHKLRFPLLSDAGNQVARQFGLVYRVPDDQQAIYRRAFVNLPFTNGDQSWELPIPATFIVDRDGTILFASADEDYTQRPEPREILERLSPRD